MITNNNPSEVENKASEWGLNKMEGCSVPASFTLALFHLNHFAFDLCEKSTLKMAI